MAVVDAPKGSGVALGPVGIFTEVLKLGPLSGKGRGPSFEQRFSSSPEFNDPVALGRQIAKGQARIDQATAPTVRGFRGRMVSQAEISPIVRLEVSGLNKSLEIARARLGVLESRTNAPVLNSGPIYASVGIPAATADIFKGTTAGRAARTVGTAIGKGARGGVVGVAIYGGIEAANAIIKAREDQIKAENKAYESKTAREEKSDNRRVDQIRREAAAQLAKEAREAAARERAFRSAEAQKERDAKANERKASAIDRERTRKAKATAKAILKQIKEDAKAFEKQQKAKAAAEKARKERLAKLLGLGISAIGLGKANRAAKQSQSRALAPPIFNFNQAPSAATPLLAEQLAETRTATKSRVETCRSDTPKRKPGKCRTGFFRETPNRTIYKTWSEKTCL